MRWPWTPRPPLDSPLLSVGDARALIETIPRDQLGNHLTTFLHTWERTSKPAKRAAHWNKIVAVTERIDRELSGKKSPDCPPMLHNLIDANEESFALIPCGACGGKALLTLDYEDSCARCEKCGTRTRFFEEAEWRDAVEAWNDGRVGQLAY